MGMYINPTDMTKEEWLAKHGEHVNAKPPWDRDVLPVCLIDNIAFTAAGVAYSPAELEAFASPDPRPRKWYRVARVDLEAVIPELKGRK